ncbi:MAG TPA: hypothetical protein VGK61_10610 [Planctomycetota bacterium]
MREPLPARRPWRPLAPALVFMAGALFLVAKGNLLATASPAPATPEKALIYAGWYGNTIPTPSYIASNQDFLESQPFNGMVVYLRNPSMSINATTGVMTNSALSYASISSVLDPIRNLAFTHLLENFAYVVGNSPPDFFDDWSVPIQNFANLAHALKDAGIKGIFFDNEEYFSPWAAYPLGVSYPLTPLADYQSQARLRGKQVMEAMVAQFPDIVVLTLHGPYISEPAAPWQLGFPSVVDYNALMGPFFAGFQEGKGSQATNVDGGELYWLRSASEFQDSYNWRRYDMASSAVNCAFLPPALRATWSDSISIGFGVYDQPSGGRTVSPSSLTTTLANALQQSDRYVWFYTETMTFLAPESAGGATQTWIDAVAAALPAASVPPANPPAPLPSPTVSGTGEEARSSCGLLGIEVIPIMLAIGFLRARRRRKAG